MDVHVLFSFRPVQVTLWMTVIYLALLVPIVYIQETVPSAPKESALPDGISLSEAWADLANLTERFHPANSPANDAVRSFLISRICEILDKNDVSWALQEDRVSSTASRLEIFKLGDETLRSDVQAVLFDDLRSNITFSKGIVDGKQSAVHFEGSNVYVYIRGSSDRPGDWWKQPVQNTPTEKQIVLVNAHFDSVPSSYGATDDGVGVVAALQLIRFFTTPGQQPRRGIVVLLNNAEEDYLLGASAFANSALAPFIGTFVNLEGAGAGGRAILFRSTDLEVVSAYRGSPHPFGSVFSSDGFKAGLIRSETDYRIWVNILGYRGIDLAFYRPRARYHTSQDDRRHTSQDSVWHMLSGALTSAKSLSGTAGDRVDLSSTDGVWFDFFGRSMALFPLAGLFAWTLVLLIIPPLIFALVLYLLYRTDRDYLFNTSVITTSPVDTETVALGGWKGFCRFPFALIVAGGVVCGASLLLRRTQPLIIHSSLYTVLVLMFTLFFTVFWLIMRCADALRPSAFHRAYALFWLSVFTWVFLAVTAVMEDRNRIASGYIVVFWASGVFLAFLISLVENFSLPRKAAFAQDVINVASDHDVVRDAVGDGHAITGLDSGEAEDGLETHNTSGETIISTEETPLLGGNLRSEQATTFSTGYRRSLITQVEQGQAVAPDKREILPFGGEQQWSSYLPSWTWYIQFLLLGPLTILLTAQLGLSVAASIHQTGTDGSDPLLPYLFVAFFTILLLLPTTPFIHRVTRHIPFVFIVVFAGTLSYCLTSFPFSAISPYKFFIRQTFSVDTGIVKTIFTGHRTYIDKIVCDLPSIAERRPQCFPSKGRVAGLVDYAFDASGLEPRVNGTQGPFSGYSGFVSINATRWGTGNGATLEINAVNSESCTLRFERPARDILVRDSLGWDTRFDSAQEDRNRMIAELSLWRRDRETPWVVDVEWGDDAEMMQSHPVAQQSGSSNESSHTERKFAGLVVCGWTDATTGTAPAVDEAWKYAPDWSIVSIKSNPPLVEGSKRFSI